MCEQERESMRAHMRESVCVCMWVYRNQNGAARVRSVATEGKESKLSGENTVQPGQKGRPFALEQLGRIHGAYEEDLVHGNLEKLAEHARHVSVQKRTRSEKWE